MGHLQSLPEINPDVFEKIVKVHDKSIKELASNDPSFFQAVCRSLVFDTNKGRLSLHRCESFLDKTSLFYLEKDAAVSAQYAQIADANDYFYCLCTVPSQLLPLGESHRLPGSI